MGKPCRTQFDAAADQGWWHDPREKQNGGAELQERTVKPTEILLDQADGLDWETFCRCGIVLVIETAKVGRQRGQITLERRNAIRDKIRDIFRLTAWE